MEMIGYGKSAIWTGITVLLSLLDANVIAQQGFLSIDCGGKTNYTDENNIIWVTDHNYIDVGEIADTGSSTSPSYLQTLRFFPKPLNKSCYQLPVVPHVPYLLRLQFSVGNYSKFSGSRPSFTCTIETSGMLMNTYPSVQVTGTSVYEGIFVSSGTVLFVCFVKTSDTDDPFINAIELRALRNGMYSQATPGTMLHLQTRINVGGNSPVRYPLDNFDRIWKTNRTPTDPNIVLPVSTPEPISSNNTKNLPPTAVMQTAWVMNGDGFPFTPPTESFFNSLLLLYFAEIERLNISEYRSFYVTRTGENPSATITLVGNYSALELTFISRPTIIYRKFAFVFDLVEAPNSTRRPIINAYEFYTIQYTQQATSPHDIEALNAIKSKYGIKDWISDPCFCIPWKGLGCIINSSSPVRISAINLSGRNLTGSLPEEIGQLTALINVALDNNNLIGPLPNLSGLNMLERLHLQNNSFSGILPNWLFNLKNLHELFIQNNNFSGVIPAELPDRTSMTIQYSGNKYFCIMYKAGDCIQEIQKPKNKSKTVVLGIIISGCLIALMVGIAVYWRKKRETQRLNQDFSLTLSKLTNFRAFTGKEMVEATENFSRQIGQGGSGSVFSGKLREENDILIAVKVLSSLHQFLNEVTVISRAQHENLVSLVGYCSESKNLMLIYEYMSGGSLWRSLHDTSAGISNLNWKTRLNIALDVANGLEFLHVGCTPKIIHMDVKTANILLDSNNRAKLSDFGLSRIATDGEASHATMTMANGTPGYIDPEYRLTHRVTEKSDVYSFGVVLFEIISGKRVTNANDEEEEINLVEWVTPKVRNEDVDAEIIDERLAGNYDKKSIVRVAKVALRCVKDSSFWRPSISEVVREIKEAIIDETENNAQLPVSEEIGIEH